MLKRILVSSLVLLTACGDNSGQIAKSSGPQNVCSSRSSAEIGGPISLINQDGQPVTQEDFKGQYSVVFFGFTYCPDVCPFTLNRIHQALEELPDDVETPQTIMISIDPERDTPDLIKTYISNDGFPEDIVGLTGSEEDVAAAAKNFVAYYQRAEDTSSSAGYTMDHSTLIYLMDENWELKTFFTHESHPTDMASCMASFLPEKES